MQSKPQLFCFTYAGGTSSFFNEIESELSGLEVIKPDYAGHGGRHKESFYAFFSEMSDDMYRAVKEAYSGGRYGLFGYSMGSIVLVEVLKRIIADGFELPYSVFLAAYEPHSKPELLRFNSDDLDEWVKERTIEFGAIPEKLINNKAFWRVYLPIYKNDYGLIGHYRFEDLNLQTDIPATVFYSEEDTPLSDMKLWEKYLIGPVEYMKYTENHFFIYEHYKEMAEIISKSMGISNWKTCIEREFDI